MICAFRWLIPNENGTRARNGECDMTIAQHGFANDHIQIRGIDVLQSIVGGDHQLVIILDRAVKRPELTIGIKLQKI